MPTKKGVFPRELSKQEAMIELKSKHDICGLQNHLVALVLLQKGLNKLQEKGIDGSIDTRRKNGNDSDSGDSSNSSSSKSSSIISSSTKSSGKGSSRGPSSSGSMIMVVVVVVVLKAIEV